MRDKKNIILLVILIVFLIVCTGLAYYVYTTKPDIEEPITVIKEKEIEDETDGFSIYDKEKNEVKLSDYEGKAVFILFWKTDSEESLEMVKLIEKYYDTYKDNVTILLTCVSNNISEPMEKVQEYLTNNEIKIETYYDLNSEAVLEYNVREIPTSVALDKEHNVLNVKKGVMTEDALEANLDILSDNI